MQTEHAMYNQTGFEVKKVHKHYTSLLQM